MSLLSIQNHHPDMPRRPLTQYMVYFLEKKEKVAKSHPELDMVCGIPPKLAFGSLSFHALALF